MKTDVTLIEAFEFAKNANPETTEEKFIYAVKEALEDGRLHATGYKARQTPFNEMFFLVPAERQEIPRIQWRELSLSFAWGGCATKGNPQFIPVRMTASDTNVREYDLWVEIFLLSIDVQSLLPERPAVEVDGIDLISVAMRLYDEGERSGKKHGRRLKRPG